MLSAKIGLFYDVFLPCGLTAAQMSFHLVFFQNAFYLIVKLFVYFFQSVRYVFMYGTLTYSEFLCNGAHGEIIFYKICPQYDTSFFGGRYVHHKYISFL